MLKNYLTVTVRSIKRNRLYAFTNIVGLAAAMVGFIVVALYINYEMSYDKFHKDVEDIRILKMKYANRNGDHFNNMLPAVLATVIDNEIPGIEKATATGTGVGNIKVISEAGELIPEKYYAFENSFFDIFSFKAKYGLLTGSLSQPDGIVISRKTALKYFNRENVVGEFLEIERRGKFVIKAVLDDFPPNSQFQPHLVFSLVGVNSQLELNSWGMNSYFVYLKKSKGVADGVLADQIETLYTKNSQEGRMYTGETKLLPFAESYWEWSGSGASLNNRQKGLGADKDVMLICGVLAAFLMIIALTNYVNLAISRAVQRAKEVGIRKVNGALPRQLIFQFLSESIVFSLISLVLAVVAVELLMPSISQLMGATFSIDYLQLSQLVILIAYALFCGIAAGIYPAIILSRFQPSRILRSKGFSNGKGRLAFKALLWFQFTLCAFMLTAVFVMNGQIRHYLNFDLGFTKDQVVSVNIPRENRLSENFVKEVMQLPQINGATVGPLPYGAAGFNNMYFNENSVRYVSNFKTDDTFISTLNVKILEGRNFDPELATDFTSGIIINSALQEKLGLTEPIGAIVQMDGYNQEKLNKTVVGVIEDIHLQGPSRVVRPLAILPSKQVGEARQNLIVKLDNKNVGLGLDAVAGSFEDFFKDEVFEFEFLDQAYAKNYHRVQRLTTLLNGVGTLIISISLFGLFGMIAFTISSRMKEIGVRKVLGVTFLKLQWTLTRQFLFVITLAVLVAIPLAYLLMDNLLDSYYNRLSLTWEYGGLVILGIYSLTILTVLGKGVSTLNLNPVEILRND